MDLTVHVKQASQVSYVILVKNILIVRNVVLEIIQLNWSCDIKFSVFLIWYGIFFFGFFSSLKKQPPSILTYINSFSSLQGMTCPTWVSSGMTKCSTNFPQLQDTFVSPVVWMVVGCLWQHQTLQRYPLLSLFLMKIKISDIDKSKCHILLIYVLYLNYIFRIPCT